MAETSPRMGWPYPSENEQPWFEIFEDFIRALDASAYAGREDRNLILMGGGTVSWDGTTLSWSEPIEVLSPNTGLLAQIPAGSISPNDGQVVRGDIPRAIGINTSMALGLASFAANNNNSILFAIRRGTRVYWRNGLLMESGDSVDGLGAKQGGGGVTNTFVYRPGGTQEDNVYTSFADLYAVASTIQGPVTLQIDDNITSPAVLPDGNYNFNGWTIAPAPRPDGAKPQLQLEANVTIAARLLTIGAVRIDQSLNSIKTITIASDNAEFTLIGAEIDSSAGGAQGFFSCEGGQVFCLLQNAQLRTGCVNVDAPGFFVVLANGLSVVRDDAIRGPDGTVAIAGNRTDIVEVGVQPNFLGALQIAWPYNLYAGPLSAEHVGTVEKHIGSIYIPGGTRILGGSRALIGCVSNLDNCQLIMRRFTGGGIILQFSQAGNLASVNLGSDTSIADDDWYDLFLVGGSPTTESIVRGLELVSFKNP